MKRILSIFLSLLLLTSLMTSCKQKPQAVEELEAPTEALQQAVVSEAPLTDEERAIIALADAEILKKYPIESLDHYQISIDQGRNGDYFVRYKLMIGNYRTYESYTVELNADKTIGDVYGDYGEYAAYLPYATEEKIRAAEEKLEKQLEKYDERSHFYLSIDGEGYLCLNAEIIIKYEGTFEGGGCGIDHDHKFFTERICSLP